MLPPVPYQSRSGKHEPLTLSTTVSIMFTELQEDRKCGQCRMSVEDVFVNPSCDHVLCCNCLASTPPLRCPDCQGEVVAERMAPDRAFKALWAMHNSHRQSDHKSSTVDEHHGVGTSRIATPKGAKCLWKRNSKGETYLHQYCTLGFNKKKGFNIESLKAMIAEGANPNTYDASGVTPMHEAVLFGDLTILKVLLDGGGRVNSWRLPPSTLLHEAVKRFSDTAESLELVKTLLDYGADVNARDSYNRRPIDIASNFPTLIQLLTSYRPTLINRKELYAPESVPVIFPGTSDKSMANNLKHFSNRFKIKVLPSKSIFLSEVTHVILPKEPTESSFVIRLAILSGCFVVTMDWLSESLKQDCLLPAEDFEISKPLIVNSSAGYVTRRARLNARKLAPKLFANSQFHIVTNMEPLEPQQDKARIARLVEVGGGTIMTREPRSTAADVNGCRLFHAPEGSMFEKCSLFLLFSQMPKIRYNMPHMKHVPQQWLYDCIDTFSILEW